VTAAAVGTALLAFALETLSQGAGVSPAAARAHQGIARYDGPATCLECHETQATEVFHSVHYQETGPTPYVTNIDGFAGQAGHGAIGFNSYCGTQVTSRRATCAGCHVGNGRFPSPTISHQQLENIDCMMCHQQLYRRRAAPPYDTVEMPAPDGGTRTIQVPVEDETGFSYMPDEANMVVSALEAARTVHRTTRASCVRCHAFAAGANGAKRGDLSSVSASPPLSSDVHLSPRGANLTCARCHAVGDHRFMGRGLDLRPNDSPERLECSRCHGERPHGDFHPRKAESKDLHAMRVACQTCHIPTYAKDVPTEVARDWRVPEFSPGACSGQGGWAPNLTLASNVVPSYGWFDGTSQVYVLGRVPQPNRAGEYALATPNGSVSTPGAKIYPMKEHRSVAARHDATGQLIPHSTYTYFTTASFEQAVAEGQAQSGLQGAYTIVPTHEFQTINHGVEPEENALRCSECHGSAGFSGGPARMDLWMDFGYELKAPPSQVCSQCHGAKRSKGFKETHAKHVDDKRIDCSMCHSFSRPERGLIVGIVR
jgi:Cytochrome c bacterial